MFLNELSSKTKENFWELANLLVAADKVVTDEEKAMLEQYRMEMQLDLDTSVSFRDVKAIIQDILDEPMATRRIVLLELLGLAYADSAIAPEENEVLQSVQDAFSISQEKRTELMHCVEDVIQLHTKIMKAILGGE